ncbi:UDP-glucose 4-epimerase GalE [Leptospirillum ferriphilum]|uniref:UDP-glucose 4-epimerase GalE n=1 Tax=Leptospirillum ferriphilum TaxID=178606 RepID=UPI003EE55DC7
MILVTGGAGYIGSHMVRVLIENGFETVILDNLSHGTKEVAVQTGAPLVVGDIRDPRALTSLFSHYPIEAVIHFAAAIEVGESVQDPLKYWDNNLNGTLRILETMRSFGVRNLILSSTAAVYSPKSNGPITEEDRIDPQNPYGETKAAAERLVEACRHAFGVSSVIFRYFNAAALEPSYGLVSHAIPRSHLIPAVLDAIAGRIPSLRVFGNDYPTPDGTGVRDYIHVMDLAEAHLVALKRLLKGEISGTFNLGTGQGHSVLDVIRTAEKVTGKKVPYRIEARRPGDVSMLVASGTRARQTLPWFPSRSSLERIMEDSARGWGLI